MEAALSIYLESFATTLGSREQLAIAEFADALLTIPKTLAVNAAQVRCPVQSQPLHVTARISGTAALTTANELAHSTALKLAAIMLCRCASSGLQCCPSLCLLTV